MRYLLHVNRNMKIHVLSAHEQVILFKVRQHFASLELRVSYTNCKATDFAELDIVASMEDKVVVDEYIAVLLSISAGGRHGVFGWMRTIVDLEVGM